MKLTKYAGKLIFILRNIKQKKNLVTSEIRTSGLLVKKTLPRRSTDWAIATSCTVIWKFHYIYFPNINCKIKTSITPKVGWSRIPNHIELSIGILKNLYYQFQTKPIKSFWVMAIHILDLRYESNKISIFWCNFLASKCKKYAISHHNPKY